jgi:hypothetical protein
MLILLEIDLMLLLSKFVKEYKRHVFLSECLGPQQRILCPKYTLPVARARATCLQAAGAAYGAETSAQVSSIFYPLSAQQFQARSWSPLQRTIYNKLFCWPLDR